MDDLGQKVESPPIVSVLVTVFNREVYLEETIESILKSSWTDFELILVDDASTDASLAIAKKIARKDERVRVVANEKNLGDYSNRNKAASLAKGKYIKYVDSDDLIYPHSLGLMVESMNRNPEAAFALSHSRPEDESPYPWALLPTETYRKHFLGAGCLSCGPSAAIIRREAYESVGGFRQHWKVLADTDLWLRLASRWPTVLLPPGLVWWRRHEGQEYTRGDAEINYLKRGYQLDIEALSSAECPLDEIDRQIAFERKRQHFARRLLSLAIRKRQPGSALSIYRTSGLSPADLLKGFRSYR